MLGAPLMAYQLEMMAALGVRTVVVVIGHLGHEVVRALGDGSRWGVEIRYVEQEETLGLSASALTQLTRGLATWRTLLPRKASDTVIHAFLRHGASAWVLRASQAGGDDPDIAPNLVVNGRSIAEWRDHCDQTGIEKATFEPGWWRRKAPLTGSS